MHRPTPASTKHTGRRDALPSATVANRVADAKKNRPEH
jgi:hypothetical protein